LRGTLTITGDITVPSGKLARWTTLK